MQFLSVYFHTEFVLYMHHGGTFVNELRLLYLGDHIKYIYNVDLDRMLYFELKGLVEEIGYNNVSKLFFKVPKLALESGLKFINNDKDIVKM